MEKQGETTKAISREQSLRDYWQARIESVSVWGDVVGRAGKSINRNAPLRDTLQTINERIYYGQPLTFAEYHLAQAFGYIMGERTYEDFYKNCWHETKTHYGTQVPATCDYCQRETPQ